MTKTLTIVRHAKAERPEGFASDFDRPLTTRGQNDAERIGAALKRLAAPIDWWISSPALRTRQTIEGIHAVAGAGQPIQWEPAIYEASAETLLVAVSRIPPEAEHALIVGHNPGMEELVAGLAAGAPERLNLRMPTAAVAHLQLELFRWDQLRWGCGRLELLFSPKLLKK